MTDDELLEALARLIGRAIAHRWYAERAEPAPIPAPGVASPSAPSPEVGDAD